MGRARPSAEHVDQAICELVAAFGNRTVTSWAVREQHGNTTTWIACEPPDAVLYPQSTQDVQLAVGICTRNGVPVIPFGTGSSFEGSVNAPYGGICLDFKDMDHVLSVHADDFDCIIEPGITRKRLNEALREWGLFFSVDPGADASLGGMAATRASGTTALRYGTMKDNVLAMQVVLANGELVSTSRRARKSSAGYDLTRLIVGAEGTLGVITQLTVKLHGIPDAVSAGACAFASLGAACGAAIAAIQAGIPMARLELLDEVQVRACNADAKLGLAEQPTLFFECHGTDAAVAEQAAQFGSICEDAGGARFAWSTKAEERNRLWAARHHVFWANRSFRPGADALVTDVCVPISRLAECIVDTKRDIVASGLLAPIVAHAGDGNFHCVVLVMGNDAQEIARARSFNERLVERSLAMDGTCTGEHAIGQGKMKFLEAEHGQPAVAMMRAIKKAVDPDEIMNPGKIF